MGIKNLMKLLEEEAPHSFKEANNKCYSSRIIAIDASIQLYQFLVQVRISDPSGSYSHQMMSDDGSSTGHLQGFLSRTVNLMENGIKPVYVFDGAPPELKYKELCRRRKLKDRAENELGEAKQRLENAETEEEKIEALSEIEKMNKRTVRVTKEHNEEAKHLLRLMGIPVVDSPSEAEAQCSELVKGEKAYAVASEDMDTLVFSTPILLKRLTDSKHNTVEINFNKVLSGLELNYDQFVDLCILCGCDYCETIPGIGYKTAFKLIKKEKSIENILNNNEKIKARVDEEYIHNLNNIRKLFKKPIVIPSEKVNIKFDNVKEDELLKFLVVEKNFNLERVKKMIERIKNVKKKGTQLKIDSFFKQKQ